MNQPLSPTSTDSPPHSDATNAAFPVVSRLSRRALVGGAIGSAGLIGAAGRARPAEAKRSMTARLLGLPLAEKVAQLFVFEANGTSMSEAYDERLRTTRPGGVVLVGANVGTPEELRAFVRAIHDSNPEMPPLVAVDQEGGLVSRVPDDPAPDPTEMGQLSSAEARAASEARAVHLRRFGFDVNLAPVADIAYASDSSMAMRSYGTDPSTVARTVAAVVTGERRTRIVGSAKHFPGHGRTSLDSHDLLPSLDVTLDEWWETDAEPFRAAIAADVESVMLGHLRFPNWPGWDDAAASFSPVAVDLLRRDLGFTGVIVTDDLGMDALAAWDPLEVVDRAIDAGVDVLLYVRPPLPDADLIGHLVDRIERGELSEDRIDKSLRRIARIRRR